MSAVGFVLDAPRRHFGVLRINGSHQTQFEFVGHRFDGGEVRCRVFLLQVIHQGGTVLRVLNQDFVATADAGQMNAHASRRQCFQQKIAVAR